MKEYDGHILKRGKNSDNESDSERLIREANTREYYQWKNVRRFIFILSVIIVLISVLMLAETIR
ncbi:TPA: hypothetical protein I8Y13_003992 [Raoultella planticola]|uniref:hypothetical protein n=1 Tax=Escherichia coli TaxID=562 RepID=UPI001A274C37|nr:hypothetical protein [Escherichia coli]UMS25414.1 hypothetical protein AOY81_04455 [Escherichia coli]HAT1637759.1 hypothetical protein [Raoultella planticola]HAT1676094.1 hypothetical protein [Raoultella planticola]